MLKKVKAEGLAHLSYIVGSDGKAAVIDPRRDCGIYLDIADEEGLRITHILETHRNEDYVTGSRELSSMTGRSCSTGT
jgi:hydroxyacylglutathione hydrolase